MRFNTAALAIAVAVALAALGASLVAELSIVRTGTPAHPIEAARALCRDAFGGRSSRGSPASVRNIRTPAHTDLPLPARPEAFPGLGTRTFVAYCVTTRRTLFAVASGYPPVFVKRIAEKSSSLGETLGASFDLTLSRFHSPILLPASTCDAVLVEPPGVTPTHAPTAAMERAESGTGQDT